jgi:two-component system OmpR family response regulator
VSERVLLIEDDEWESALLARAMRDAGFEVFVESTAKGGLAKAIELQPACIICDLMLPDVDGSWVARKIRTDPSRLSMTPFVFLTGVDDKQSRMQGFNVGADAYLTKPFRHDEVVAQVRALIAMARRMSAIRDSIEPMSSPTSSPLPPAVKGDLAHLSLPTILTIFEMERRTGRLKIKTDGNHTAMVHLASGMVVRTTLDAADKPTVEVFREILRWTRGHFAFRPGSASIPSGGAGDPIQGALLEAMRLEDEAKERG